MSQTQNTTTATPVSNGKRLFVDVVEGNVKNVYEHPYALVPISTSQKKVRETSSLPIEFWLGF